MELARWIEHRASHTPDKIAIRFEGEEISYREFERRVTRLASVLSNTLGVKSGTRVAHLAYNNPIFLLLIFACARIGAVLVPLNFRLSANEISWLLQDCGASVLFCDHEFLPICKEAGTMPLGCQLLLLEAATEQANCASLLQLMDAQPEAATQYPVVSPDTPLLIVYTSGTTGRPKGVVLDSLTIRWNALNSRHMHGLSHRDHILCLLPFFHVGGINIQTLPALRCGACVTLVRQFDPALILDMLVEQKPTLVVLVPTQMRALAELPQWETADLSSLRAVSTGSTLVDSALLNKWRAHGIPSLQVYGCTESSPIAINQTINDPQSPRGTAGRAARYCDVRLVDEHNKEVPPGQNGEIQLRGPNIMRGYWNNPQATKEALKDGWLATGDVAYSDEQGYFFVVDRIKNMIISGGENIYPAELENILLEHPEIDQAAVVGLPDPHWSEIVAAAIVRRPGSLLDADTVLDLFEGRVGHFKHPRKILFLADLPRNTMGKLLYQELRALILASTP
jgi:fatty-acyl-CoA synthase